MRFKKFSGAIFQIFNKNNIFGQIVQKLNLKIYVEYSIEFPFIQNEKEKKRQNNINNLNPENQIEAKISKSDPTLNNSKFHYFPTQSEKKLFYQKD